MAAFWREMVGHEGVEATDLIIPSDVLKGIKKTDVWVDLESLDGGMWRLGNTIFKPIEGRYPDYNRIIPDSSTLDGLPCFIEPELSKRGFDAIQTFYTKQELAEKNGHLQVGYSSDRQILTHSALRNSLVVLMHRRIKAGYSKPSFN